MPKETPERGNIARDVVRKLICEFGGGVDDDEKIVAIRVEAIVEGKDHRGIKGFSSGAFDVRKAKLDLSKLIEKEITHMLKDGICKDEIEKLLLDAVESDDDED